MNKYTLMITNMITNIKIILACDCAVKVKSTLQKLPLNILIV